MVHWPLPGGNGSIHVCLWGWVSCREDRLSLSPGLGHCEKRAGVLGLELSQKVLDIWKERCAFREAQWSRSLAPLARPCPLLFCFFPLTPHKWLGLSTEPKTYLVEHILEIQLQVADQEGWQGKAGQGLGQAGCQVSAERTAGQMLQRPGLPHQGEER